MYDGTSKVPSYQGSQRKRKSSSSSEESALTKSSSPEEGFDVGGHNACVAAMQMPPLPSIAGAAVEEIGFRESAPSAHGCNDTENNQGPAKKRYVKLHYTEARDNPKSYSEADVSVAMILARGMGR